MNKATICFAHLDTALNLISLVKSSGQWKEKTDGGILLQSIEHAIKTMKGYAEEEVSVCAHQFNVYGKPSRSKRCVKCGFISKE